MSFLDELKQEESRTVTENGAPSFSSTLDQNLNFFAQAGAMRHDPKEVVRLFIHAYNENKDLALRNLVHLRNIRWNGAGERDASVEVYKELSIIDFHLFTDFMPYIADIGRWDDLVQVYYKHVTEGRMDSRRVMADFFKAQLETDAKAMALGERVTLLAKWLPSPSAHKESKVKTALSLAHDFGWSPKKLRKQLSALRSHLNIIEKNLAQKEYDAINLEEIPSRAVYKYRHALSEHLPERWNAYLEDVKSGKATMNTSNILPHEIAGKFMYSDVSDETLELMWENLPNYIEEDDNVLVMADVSGSMSGMPMQVSVSLALYTAERLRGAFKNHFMTFSERPQLVSIPESLSLSQKMRSIGRAHWDMNTDFAKAMRLILDTAVKNKTPKEELPSKLIVISDMQFDSATSSYGFGYGATRRMDPYNDSVHQVIRQEFKNTGYEMPEMVYWNVNARPGNLPVQNGEANVALISGITPALLVGVLGKELPNPKDLMKQVLLKPEYDFVSSLFS